MAGNSIGQVFRVTTFGESHVWHWVVSLMASRQASN